MTERENNSSISQQIDHSLNDVWTAVRRQGESIAEIRQGLNGIADALSDFKAEIHSIRDIATRPRQPVNWVAIASLCVAILIAAGSYASSVIKPVKQDADDALLWTRERSKTLIGDYKEFGRVIERSEHNQDMAILNEERLDNFGERIAHLEGTVDGHHQWLKEVDSNGSRAWNRSERRSE